LALEVALALSYLRYTALHGHHFGFLNSALGSGFVALVADDECYTGGTFFRLVHNLTTPTGLAAYVLVFLVANTLRMRKGIVGGLFSASCLSAHAGLVAAYVGSFLTVGGCCLH